MEEKSMAIALVISFVASGLGIAYAGNFKKGLTIFAIAVLCNILGTFVSLVFSYIALIIWAVGMYLTYVEVKVVNGA